MNYSVVTVLLFMLSRIHSWAAYEGIINGSGTTIINGHTFHYIIAAETGDWITAGDIRIGPPSLKRRLVPIINDRIQGNNLRWDDCTIPYQFGGSDCPNDCPNGGSDCQPNAKMQIEIKKAIDHWSQLTDGLVRLVPRYGETDFIYFCETQTLNDSPVGRQGGGQRINLARGQISDLLSIAVHEIGHSFGFGHTHNRYDRDDYISVQYSNLKQMAAHNYDKAPHDMYTDCDQEYDYRSVMHYPGYSTFAIVPGTPILRPTYRYQFPGWSKQNDFGSHSGLSHSDATCAKQVCTSTLSPTSAPTNPLVICNYDDYDEFDENYHKQYELTRLEKEHKEHNDWERWECEKLERDQKEDRFGFERWQQSKWNWFEWFGDNGQEAPMSREEQQKQIDTMKEEMERNLKKKWDDRMIELRQYRDNRFEPRQKTAPNAPYNMYPAPDVSNIIIGDESDDSDSKERSDSSDDDNTHKAISNGKSGYHSGLRVTDQKDAFMTQLIIGDVVIVSMVVLSISSFVCIMRHKS